MIFSALVVFSVNKKTMIHFIGFAAIYFAASLLIDFVYGRMIDKKIRAELESLEKKEN